MTATVFREWRRFGRWRLLSAIRRGSGCGLHGAAGVFAPESLFELAD